MSVFLLGKNQVAGIEIYVADPAHDDPESREVARMWNGGTRLHVPEGRAMLAHDVLVDAANSADAHMEGGRHAPDVKLSVALGALATRVMRVGREEWDRRAEMEKRTRAAIAALTGNEGGDR